MEFIMDMVHHNPGEAPFATSFLDPAKLSWCGYNGQVFKHINTVVTFEKADPTLFDNDPEARAWIARNSERIAQEVNAAKQQGLQVFYHIDLFVLPKAVVERYRDEICDENGKISLLKEKTLELHRIMFDEIFERFPIDGFIIRVGETYLHDTPYHIGNGAVRYGNRQEEQDQLVRLITFLREEVCVKHGKHLFFRTWDLYHDRFHANKAYYEAVTDRIPTHEKLLFSVKHTCVDFWRRAKFNECLTAGKHRQVVEVQCQREYEGKGAYPMYVMKGVINSFPENKKPIGLRDIVDHPLISGVYSWSRGGGWFGPYPKKEFWCELNTYVLARYCKDPSRTEKELFDEYATDVMRLSPKDLPIWRKLCLTSTEALLRGRYIEAFDRTYDEGYMPSANWMRDDQLGGLTQLGEIFDYLYTHDLLDAAVIEKKTGCLLWQEAARLFQQMTVPDAELSAFIETSIEYAIRLFEVIYCGWQVMAIGYAAERSGLLNKQELTEAIAAYDAAWAHYRKLAENPNASTLYGDLYRDDAPGLGASVAHCREML